MYIQASMQSLVICTFCLYMCVGGRGRAGMGVWIHALPRSREYVGQKRQVVPQVETSGGGLWLHYIT